MSSVCVCVCVCGCVRVYVSVCGFIFTALLLECYVIKELIVVVVDVEFL